LSHTSSCPISLAGAATEQVLIAPQKRAGFRLPPFPMH